VVETDVHYPTDINLLYDAMRKVITLVARVSDELGLTGWRQSKHNLKKLKQLYRHAQQLKRTGAGTAERAKEKQCKIREAHREYIVEAARYVEKVQTTIRAVSYIRNVKLLAIVFEVENYPQHAERQIDQIRRRVIDGQTIPHEEKVFSIFQPHTEWISKGKAGVPQELGLRVCIVEDQYGFVLNHLVMKKSGDEKVAVQLLEETKREYPTLVSCSFDKNFYSRENKKRLSAILKTVALPKKGKLTEEQRTEESQEAFVAARQQHSAVESGIHALENHGLDRCLDSGLRGFERYVAWAVMGRNIQVLGTILWKKEEQRKKRKVHAKQAA
jgi:transposase, IS5 family